MRKLKLEINLEEHKGIEDLSEDVRSLIKKAQSVVQSAYAPYSNFPVSCVIQFEDGSSVEATNQENIAAPSGLCAESVAFFAAGSQHTGKKITRCVVYASRVITPITPCGSCRQVMSEYENMQGEYIQVIMCNKDLSDIFVAKRVMDLLPYSFSLKGYKRHKN